jgi:ethanolaminephosphotransferase
MAMGNDSNGDDDSANIKRPGRATLSRFGSFDVPEEFLKEDLSASTRDLMSNGNKDKDAPQDKDSADEPRDETLTSCLFFEPPVAAGNISIPGLHFIATHKYRPGDYTHLDNLLNPVWTWLTELLPMWLAPNMVTTIGGLHCAVVYFILWWYAADFDVSPPDWAVMLSGWCSVAYYTLDCMDGKQARRTGSSSPLGQLFDHGFDCICTLFTMSTIGSYLMIGGTYWYVLLQTTIQLAFFMAQWEEYHTHILPHCTGKWLGVSEVNYGLGTLAFVNGFLDREAVYQRPMKEVFAPLGDAALRQLPTVLKEMELRYFLLATYGFTSVVLMLLCIKRVMTHKHIASDDFSPAEKAKKRFNAMSKLATPVMLMVAAFIVPPTAVRTRYLSVTVGLAFSLLTKKMIVFSMAKQKFAMVQWEAVPLLIASLWIRFDHSLSKENADFLLGVLCIWYTFRLLRWASITTTQICEKLNIYCFRLKKRKEE